MEFYDRNGVTIAYKAEGRGPLVMFLHNGGASSSIWRHQQRELSDRFATIAIDLPGFGESPRPRTPLTLAELVDLVAGMLDDLEGSGGSAHPSRSVLVGNCMGANIAVGVATERPDLVGGLVLVNPLTAATFCRGSLGALYRLRHRLPVVAPLLRAGSRLALPTPVATFALRCQLGANGLSRRVHHDGELLGAYRRRAQLPALLDVLDDLPAYGWLDELAEPPAVPLSLVWGAQNRVLPARAAAELALGLGAQECHVLDDCGHLPMLEDHAALTAIIDRFASAVFCGVTHSASSERVLS